VPAVPTPPEIPGVLPVPGIGTAPPPAPALPDPPRVAALPEGDEFRILFASGSEAVPDAAAALLDGIAARLAAAPDRRAQLRAYADAGGGPAREARRMSLERALAVRAALAARGVRTTRVDVRGLGATAADGPPDRVDVVIVD
jgi:outer membrane protein OmpA-like peptidoglycan-associated protein